jgi:predicted nucleic acid-binding Zn ribbon protein
MPTYVYKFVKTGETIEVQHAFTDPALTEAKHPRTGRRMAVKKVFTPVGVTFKGNGFYKNDSRGSKSTAKSSGADGAGSKDHASKDGGSSGSDSSGTSSSKDSSTGSGSSSGSESSGTKKQSDSSSATS